jgi:hypothetical protein
VNAAPGLDLHGFTWAEPGEIGGIQWGFWNTLSTSTGLQHPRGKVSSPTQADLLHFTEGGPWHGVRTPGWEAWFEALLELLDQHNSHVEGEYSFGDDETTLVALFKTKGGEDNGQAL